MISQFFKAAFQILWGWWGKSLNLKYFYSLTYYSSKLLIYLLMNHGWFQILRIRSGNNLLLLEAWPLQHWKWHTAYVSIGHSTGLNPPSPTVKMLGSSWNASTALMIVSPQPHSPHSLSIRSKLSFLWTCK